MISSSKINNRCIKLNCSIKHQAFYILYIKSENPKTLADYCMCGDLAILYTVSNLLKKNYLLLKKRLPTNLFKMADVNSSSLVTAQSTQITATCA